MTINKGWEKDVVDRLQKREQRAWKELYEAYSSEFTYVSLRYIRFREDVGDVLQNSFVKMFNAIDSFQYRGAGSLRAWASKIVINESLRYLRLSKKEEFELMDEDFPEIADETEPVVNDIPNEVILNLIGCLPVGYRVVFNLFVFEKRSHREIAEELGIAESSSASQFHRAKKLLAREIGKFRQSQEVAYER